MNKYDKVSSSVKLKTKEHLKTDLLGLAMCNGQARGAETIIYRNNVKRDDGPNEQ